MPALCNFNQVLSRFWKLRRSSDNYFSGPTLKKNSESGSQRKEPKSSQPSKHVFSFTQILVAVNRRRLVFNNLHSLAIEKEFCGCDTSYCRRWQRPMIRQVLTTFLLNNTRVCGWVSECVPINVWDWEMVHRHGDCVWEGGRVRERERERGRERGVHA